MRLTILGVDDTTKVEVEASAGESFNKVANRAGEALHYHGNFTLKETREGEPYAPAINLEDSADFMARDLDVPLYIAQIVG